MQIAAMTIAALVASAMAGSTPSGFQAEVRATTAATCDGSLGCIAGTQYCAAKNGKLINLHVPCPPGRSGKRDLSPEDLLEARADCAYVPTCIN
jgi:hypothetical protein